MVCGDKIRKLLIHLNDEYISMSTKLSSAPVEAMLANPDIAVTQIAQRLGVSPATLYRYIPAARTANTPSV
jgi:DNA-binding MurR/RpiR family transcriptional regulator